jgi:hypothetical protein
MGGPLQDHVFVVRHAYDLLGLCVYVAILCWVCLHVATMINIGSNVKEIIIF